MNLFTAHLFGVASHIVPVSAQLDNDIVTVSVGSGPFPTAKEEKPPQRETRIRVTCALRTAGRQVKLRLRNTDIHSSSMDLAVAAAIYAASPGARALPPTLVHGELSLSGQARPVRGLVPHILAGRAAGIRNFLVPASQVSDAAGLDVTVVPITHVSDLVDFIFDGSTPIPIIPREAPCIRSAEEPDYASVRGLHDAVHACTLSAVTGYPILFEGPWGTGRTLLARRLPTILPLPTPEEHLHIRTNLSASGQPCTHREPPRPFRAPHHTCSPAALFGVPSRFAPSAGEITLASQGVLYLDSINEFRLDILETLRRTVGEKVFPLSSQSKHPCDFHLAASVSPCPCGHAEANRACTLTPRQAALESGRVPRDLFPIVVRLPASTPRDANYNRDSAGIRATVTRVRHLLRTQPGTQVDEEPVKKLLATSSRRPRELRNLLRANAYLHGRSSITAEDLD